MDRYRNLALFLTLSVVWGSAFVAIDAGLEYLPPVLFAAVRYDVAGVLMLAYAGRALDGREWLPRGRGQCAQVAVGSVLLIAAYHAFLFVGQQHTTAAAAAVLVSLSPVLTTGFARALVPAEALSPVGAAGILAGLVGVAVIARPDPSNLLATHTVANLLVFLAAASFALGSVLSRRIETEIPIETMQAWSMLGGALCLHAASLALREPVDPSAWTHPEALGALAYLSLAASALGFLVYFDLLERLGPVEINTVSYVAPIVAAVVGWLYLGQRIGPATVVGFACIAVGFSLVKRRALREEFGYLRARRSRGAE